MIILVKHNNKIKHFYSSAASEEIDRAYAHGCSLKKRVANSIEDYIDLVFAGQPLIIMIPLFVKEVEINDGMQEPC